MSDRKLTKILAAIIGLALILAAVYLITIDRAEHVSSTLAIGLAVIGAIGAVLPSALPTSSKPKKKGPPPLPILMLVLAIAIPGCGDEAIGAQADIVAVGGIAWSEADAALVHVRAGELDAIVDEAREACAPDGCDDAEAEAFRARLAAAEQRWVPILACRAPIPEALRAWADGLDTAYRAQTSSIGVALMLSLGRRFLAAYGAFVDCVEAADPEIDLPGLPPELMTLASAGGEEGAR